MSNINAVFQGEKSWSTYFLERLETESQLYSKSEVAESSSQSGPDVGWTKSVDMSIILVLFDLFFRSPSSECWHREVECIPNKKAADKE